MLSDHEGGGGGNRKSSSKGHRGGRSRPTFEDDDGKPYQMSNKQEIGEICHHIHLNSGCIFYDRK